MVDESWGRFLRAPRGGRHRAFRGGRPIRRGCSDVPLGRWWRRLNEAWAVTTDTAAGGIMGYLSVAQIALLRGPVGAMVPIYGTTVLLLIMLWRAGPTKAFPL